VCMCVCARVCVRVHVCVCVCVRVRVCVRMWALSASVPALAPAVRCTCVCVCVRALHVCVCFTERERERERVCVCAHAHASALYQPSRAYFESAFSFFVDARTSSYPEVCIVQMQSTFSDLELLRGRVFFLPFSSAFLSLLRTSSYLEVQSGRIRDSFSHLEFTSRSRFSLDAHASRSGVVGCSQLFPTSSYLEVAFFPLLQTCGATGYGLDFADLEVISKPEFFFVMTFFSLRLHFFVECIPRATSSSGVAEFVTAFSTSRSPRGRVFCWTRISRATSRSPVVRCSQLFPTSSYLEVAFFLLLRTSRYIEVRGDGIPGRRDSCVPASALLDCRLCGQHKAAQRSLTSIMAFFFRGANVGGRSL